MVRDTQEFVLPSGATIEIETIPDSERGPRDAAPGVKSAGRLDEAIAPLKETVELVLAQVSGLAKDVESVSIEMGASFKGETKLVFVSGEAGATLKVTVNWKRRTDG